MIFSTEEIERLLEAHARGGVQAVASIAVDLVAARGGTMTAAEIDEAFAHGGPSLDEERALRQHITTQGATAVSLQAKVKELEERLSAATQPVTVEDQQVISELVRQGAMLAGSNELAAQGMRRLGEFARRGLGRSQTGWGLFPVREQAELRAEVKRLKVEEVLSDDGRKRWKDRAISAESRLAAVRERANNTPEMVDRFCWMAEVTEVSGDALRFVSKWVLEGDAPQEAKTHDIYACHVENCAECQRVFAAEIVEKGPAAVAVGLAVAAGLPVRVRPPYPCSPSCTHDDAATPGHPERVKERSEAVSEVVRLHPNGSCTCAWRDMATDSASSFDAGAEAVRSAVEEWARQSLGEVPPTLKAALDGAA